MTLPQQDSLNKSARYTVDINLCDLENAKKGKKTFDPFEEREVENATTDCDTLNHLMKASLGTGILAMPLAFKSAGLVNGIFATIFVAFVCTHCSYVLVKSAHVLYYKAQKTKMSFAEVAEYSCSTGPMWSRKFGLPLRYLIKIFLFVTYFGTCGAYTVIVAKSFKDVFDQWLHYEQDGVHIRVVTIGFLLPMILISWVPDLKYLSRVSMVANIFMIAGLGITLYYAFDNLTPNSVKKISLTASIDEFPVFFSTAIFAMEAIGVVMPLENNMKTPQNFVGLCGVLNMGMSGVTITYIFFGFLGYLSYGAETSVNIINNLPKMEVAAQIAKVFIAVTVYTIFGLQFFVCLNIAWRAIKERFPNKPRLANYVLRTVLATGAVLLAVAIPELKPLIGLIGAVGFSILGLIVPVLIETITFWDEGFGKFHWIAIKNIIICIIGVLALIFGAKSAIESIIS